MIRNEYEKLNGEKISLPEGINLDIQEISNNVYEIVLSDTSGRSVGRLGSDLDSMVERALKELIEMIKSHSK